MSWAQGKIAILDTETTGTDPRTARLVSFAVGYDEPGKPVDVYATLVNCGIDIPAGATEVHGITREMVKAEGVAANEAIATIAGFLDDVARSEIPLVIYNARYDWELIHAEADRHHVDLPWVPIVDPYVIDRYFDQYRKGKRTLTDVCRVYGVAMDGAHNAVADAVAAGLLARALADVYRRVTELSLSELHDAQARWFASWRESFNEWLTKKKTNTGDPPRFVTGDWPR